MRVVKLAGLALSLFHLSFVPFSQLETVLAYLSSCLDGMISIASTKLLPIAWGLTACTSINHSHLAHAIPYDYGPTTAYLVSCYPLLLSLGYRFTTLF